MRSFMKFIRKLLRIPKPECIVLVGLPGSGKTTYAKTLKDYTRISQDDQGKSGHLVEFYNALHNKKNIVVDRMNFDRKQRGRYLKVAKDFGYKTTIIELDYEADVCFKRCSDRKDHPTIKDENTAFKVIYFFTENYERPLLSEADEVKSIS